MSAIEIIGVILLIAAVFILQFVGGSAGLILGIGLGATGAVMTGVWRHKRKYGLLSRCER